MKRFGVYLVLLCLIVAIQVIGAAQSFAEDILPAGTASDTKQLAAKKGTLHIGVLAFRGPDALRNRWQSLADYLGTIIPDYRFKLVPVSLVSAPELIETRRIDFLVTNPGHFIELADRFSLSALATRERRSNRNKDGLLRYGAVVFVRSDSKIQAFVDLKHKELAAVSPQAFGGFQMAWREFRRQNLDPFTDLKKIRFMGFPQDAIVEAVLDGKVDAGTVRSGLLEALAAEGRLDLRRLRVLQPDTQYDYPYQISSSLYPEWPFASVPSVNRALNEKVLRALLKTQDKGIAKTYRLRDLWSAPLSYSPARELISAYRNRPRRLGPPPATYGQSTAMLIISGLTLVTLGGLLGYLFSSKSQATSASDAASINVTASAMDVACADDNADERFADLTTREREILCLICRGQSSKQIAETLGISPKTVEYHRSNLLQKTKAGTTPHLVQMATRLGLDQVLSPGSSR